ncbi:MAG: glycosyltransferase family 2 protein [Bacteroidetes bacterium]|nr:glycosyltransferase family 2 protein [Bacteroidota bacterium]
MKVSGFSFIRNAITFDYPIVEAIRSILPICDEVVVAVGKSEDETRSLIAGIDPKVRIIDTVWDDSLREGGRVLAVETDKAFQAVRKDSDWAFYIQGDEVLHEKYLDEVYTRMIKYKDDKKVEGLLFKYLHFYGSYQYVGSSLKWYSHEIRVVRNDKRIYSFRDAQGFKIGNNRRLRVKPLDAYMYHYGWVKDPRAMQKKQENFHKHWHDDKWIEQNVVKASEYDYSNIDALEKFDGTHPAVMKERLRRMHWDFEFDMANNRSTPKDKLKLFLKHKLGIDTGYKNYRII